MEHLDIDGKRYMKVSSAARETGYTADYIGQLCRAGKTDAKLVGRTWYVAADEISNHRRTRGRSSHEKARQNVQEQLASNKETNIPIRHLDPSGRHKHLLGTNVTYHKDDAELIPTLRSVAVVSSDKEEIVETQQQKHHVSVLEQDTEKDVPVFSPVKKGEVTWNGTIVVEPLETEAEKAELEYSKSNTVPTERHVKMKSEKERNNKPNMVISDVSSDPLEAKKRFLERMNLAHELNASAPQETKIREVTESQNSNDAVERVKKWGQPSKKALIASPEFRSAHQKHRFLSLALGTVAATGVFLLVATTFVTSSSEYRAASGTENSVFLSTFRFSNFQSATEMLTERISGIRLLSQISLF